MQSEGPGRREFQSMGIAANWFDIAPTHRRYAWPALIGCGQRWIGYSTDNVDNNGKAMPKMRSAD
ncbi:MAG: hypothetical protein M3300_08650 [Actinomycetota bacterium]|jgi:hypothetical protein|nr:hypothetical protein [Actinomycetota bacterium]